METHLETIVLNENVLTPKNSLIALFILVFTARSTYVRSAVLLRESRLSVRLSGTLVGCDHKSRNSSEIISLLVSQGCSLSADPNIADLLRREQPEILAGIEEGYRKSGFRRTKALISLKFGKTGM